MRGADRLFTSRTAGHAIGASNAARANKQPYGGRLASGTGLGVHSLSKGAFQAAQAANMGPGVFSLPQDFDGFSGGTGSGKPGGALGGSQYYKDTTVHSENMHSQQLTAMPMGAGGQAFAAAFGD